MGEEGDAGACDGGGFHQAGQLVEQPLSPQTLTPIGHDDELVGLKERVREERGKLRETEVEIEEAEVPKIPSKVYTPSAEE